MSTKLNAVAASLIFGPIAGAMMTKCGPSADEARMILDALCDDEIELSAEPCWTLYPDGPLVSPRQVVIIMSSIYDGCIEAFSNEVVEAALGLMREQLSAIVRMMASANAQLAGQVEDIARDVITQSLVDSVTPRPPRPPAD